MPLPYGNLTAETVCQSLALLGLSYRPTEVRVERRDARWVARLPGQRIAWFAASEEGRKRLQVERQVLRLVSERCSFGVPRVLVTSDDGLFDVREMVPGSVDPGRVYTDVTHNPDLAKQLGIKIGMILAEQHTRISYDDIAGWLPQQPEWPQTLAWIIDRLPRVVNDPTLLANAEAVIRAYEDVPVSESDCVLVHTDVGFHNMGIDLQTYRVNGIFDYDGAAWADRHHDFRYLTFGPGQDAMLDAAVSTYEQATRLTIHPERIYLYNAACALTFLAFRAGTRPEERSCGRTLKEDLLWSRQAITRVKVGINHGK